MTNQIDEEEAPLDPVMERVRKKMIRLLVISMGTIFISLMVVVYTIVYKINTLPEDAEEEASNSSQIQASFNAADFQETIELNAPVGAELTSSQLEGNLLVLQFRLPNSQTEVRIINLLSGEVVSTVSIK
ncbi:MAG: hypothetical protein AAGF54_13385 [Pseudomonadota bacterium]